MPCPLAALAVLAVCCWAVQQRSIRSGLLLAAARAMEATALLAMIALWRRARIAASRLLVRFAIVYLL